jgi:hypothetical protein
MVLGSSPAAKKGLRLGLGLGGMEG